MRNYKRYLKNLIKSGNKLEAYVANDILECGDDNSIKNYLNDILNYGCQSGTVCGLIYYSDTNEFYLKYQEEISALLADQLESCGFAGAAELFGDKWRKEDPLAIDVFNRNLLAWFSFEETCYRIANKLGLEI